MKDRWRSISLCELEVSEGESRKSEEVVFEDKIGENFLRFKKDTS